jgi:hypothetical protein
MLGNLGFSTPVDLTTGLADDTNTEQNFQGGGSMIRYRGLQPIEPQNQTISAVLVLNQFPIGQKRLEAHVRKIERERKLGPGEFDLEEYMRLIDDSRGTDRDCSLTELRGIVHENPYARIQFPPELFKGPYDERYGAQEGRIRQLYAGSGIKNLAADLANIEM